MVRLRPASKCSHCIVDESHFVLVPRPLILGRRLSNMQNDDVLLSLIRALYSVCETPFVTSAVHAQNFTKEWKFRTTNHTRTRSVTKSFLEILSARKEEHSPRPALSSRWFVQAASRKESFPTHRQSKCSRQCVICNGAEVSCFQSRKRKHKQSNQRKIRD